MRVLLDVSRHSGHFALRPRHVGGGGNGLNQNRLARWRSRRGGGGRSRILKVESAKHVGKLYMKKETFLSLQTITNHAGTCKNTEKSVSTYEWNALSMLARNSGNWFSRSQNFLVMFDQFLQQRSVL